MTKDEDTLKVKFDGKVLVLHHKPLKNGKDGTHVASDYYAGSYEKFTDDGLKMYDVGIVVNNILYKKDKTK